MKRAALVGLLSLTAIPALAQFPGADRVLRGAVLMSDLNISPEQEREIGAIVSARIRTRYGVVQDPAVHRYVALVGTVAAQASGKPGLAWQFIVLDTDGVNAFAAPGGFVHVTRGALALMQSEAELAGVLAHEIAHVTEQHTIKAIKKGKISEFGIQEGAAQTGGLSQLAIEKIGEKATEMVLAGFGRAEELESDQVGLVLADRVGYAPTGLGGFLTRLAERNKASTAKQGLFASHPEMKERLDGLSKQIAAKKLGSTVVLEDRYHRFVSYQPTPLAEIAQVEAGAAGLAGGTGKSEGSKAAEPSKPAEAPKKRSFGLSSLMKPAGEEKKSAQVTASGGSRGVDTERNAKGGSNPAVVAVALTAADIASFKQEGQLK